jgi:hypothetical protein
MVLVYVNADRRDEIEQAFNKIKSINNQMKTELAQGIKLMLVILLTFVPPYKSFLSDTAPRRNSNVNFH